MESEEDLNPYEQIAVIGMSMRFPGAKNTDEFWNNLISAQESIFRFSDQELEADGVKPIQYKDKKYVRAKAIIEDYDSFDANFFGYSPRDAQIIDPQQRIFLECASSALEDAGYGVIDNNTSVGVYGSISRNSYLLSNILRSGKTLQTANIYNLMVNNAPDSLATRVAYKAKSKWPCLHHFNRLFIVFSQHLFSLSRITFI